MWVLVTALVATGAWLSYHYDSLVPGILCLVMALCAFGWQKMRGE